MTQGEFVPEGQPPVPYKRPKQLGRITVAGRVYHQSAGGYHVPQTSSQGFTRLVNDDVQPYHRRLVASPTSWIALRTSECWVERVGYLRLENLEEQHIPTSENVVSGHALQLAMADENGEIRGICWIMPGEHVNFDPVSFDQLFVRSVGVQANYALTVYPK